MRPSQSGAADRVWSGGEQSLMAVFRRAKRKYKFGSAGVSRMSRGSEIEQAERFADAEIASLLWTKFRILPPTSPSRQVWDMLMLYLVMYNCIWIPLALCFSMEQNFKEGMENFDLMVDFAFLIDIGLNFRTTWVEDDELVHDARKIMMRYGTSWFLLDALATFPWQLVGGKVLRPQPKPQS